MIEYPRLFRKNFILKAIFYFLLHNFYQSYGLKVSKDSYSENDYKILNCYKENALSRDSLNQARNIKTYSYQENVSDPYIKILDILDYIDILNLEIAANCIAGFRSERHIQNRYFNGDLDGGGEPSPMSQNDVVFLTGYFEDMMPDLLEYLYQEISRALEGRGLLSKGWHPRQLGIRNFEFITYRPGISLDYHQDTESIFTLVITLSSINQYRGGIFKVLKDSEFVENHEILSEAGSGVLFDSMAQHAVSEVTSGIRSVFALEFWPYENGGLYDTRPSPIYFEGRALNITQADIKKKMLNNDEIYNTYLEYLREEKKENKIPREIYESSSLIKRQEKLPNIENTDISMYPLHLQRYGSNMKSK